MDGSAAGLDDDVTSAMPSAGSSCPDTQQVLELQKEVIIDEEQIRALEAG